MKSRIGEIKNWKGHKKYDLHKILNAKQMHTLAQRTE